MSADRAADVRDVNVGFAEELLRIEIGQRNKRKEAQESTARWIVLSVVGLMTLLLTLAKEAGILSRDAPIALQAFFVATLFAATLTVSCAGGVLWPRRYERLGDGGLDSFNDSDFLDQEPHQVKGRVVASYIAIAKRMDDLHEKKAKWLKAAFVALGITLAFLVAQGVTLAVDSPKAERPPPAAKIDGQTRWNKRSPSQSCQEALSPSAAPPPTHPCRPSRSRR